jgi:hypothetical protein
MKELCGYIFKLQGKLTINESFEYWNCKCNHIQRTSWSLIYKALFDISDIAFLLFLFCRASYQIQGLMHLIHADASIDIVNTLAVIRMGMRPSTCPAQNTKQV